MILTNATIDRKSRIVSIGYRKRSLTDQANSGKDEWNHRIPRIIFLFSRGGSPTFGVNLPGAKPLGIFAFIIGLNIQNAVFSFRYRFTWIQTQSDTFKNKSVPSREICPSLGSKRTSMDGSFVPGFRRGRPDGTNDKLFKPSARTS